MKDGFYRITFTTNSGTLGEGACLVQGPVLVGADLMHSYHAQIEGGDDALVVRMRCRRHAPDIASQLGLPLEFELVWRGRETAYGFTADAALPVGGVTLNATAHRIANEPA